MLRETLSGVSDFEEGSLTGHALILVEGLDDLVEKADFLLHRLVLLLLLEGLGLGLSDEGSKFLRLLRLKDLKKR